MGRSRGRRRPASTAPECGTYGGAQPLFPTRSSLARVNTRTGVCDVCGFTVHAGHGLVFARPDGSHRLMH